jgi:hypothetical protein
LLSIWCSFLVTFGLKLGPSSLALQCLRATCL